MHNNINLNEFLANSGSDLSPRDFDGDDESLDGLLEVGRRRKGNASKREQYENIRFERKQKQRRRQAG